MVMPSRPVVANTSIKRIVRVLATVVVIDLGVVVGELAEAYKLPTPSTGCSLIICAPARHNSEAGVLRIVFESCNCLHWFSSRAIH